MSLFVLRKGFKLVGASSGGASIVHVRTGDAIEVPAEHAKILESAAAGLDPADPWHTEVVERYRALGVLEPAAAATAPASAPVSAPVPVLPPRPAAASPPAPRASPSATAPGQGVPCLRSTLKVSRAEASSLFNVSEPSTQKTFQLYDFEVTLARMLDGRRSHSEVVDSAKRLGLPVTFDSLVRFIRELERYGFLAPAGTVAASPAAESPGAQRARDEAMLALYQSGLRMHRQGRYHESAAYFESILAQDPNHAEAREMLEQAKQRAAQPPGQALTPLPNLADRPLEQFDELSLDDAPLPVPAPGPAAIAPAPKLASPPAVAAAVQPAPAQLAARPAPPRTLIIVTVGLAALAGLAWFLVSPKSQPSPQPTPAKVVVVDAGVATEPPAVAVANVIDAGVEATGAGVDAGAEGLAVVLDAGAKVTVDGLDAGVAVTTTEIDSGAIGQGTPASARAWLDFAISRRGRVKMGEVVSPAEGTVSWKVAADQRVKRGEFVAVVRTPEGEQRLVAPVPGLVIQVAAEGGTASAEQVVANLLYHEAYLQTLVTGPAPDASWGCEVVDAESEQRADCTVGAVVPRGAGFFVTATLLPRWFDAAPNARLRLAPP